MKNFAEHLYSYENHLKGLGYPFKAIQRHLFALKVFSEYLIKKYGANDVRLVEREDLKEFINQLRKTQNRYGKLFKEGTLYHYISPVRRFMRFLFQSAEILVNPFENLEVKINAGNGERGVFTVNEMNTFLDSIDISKRLGQRDRALFELLYSAGLRTGEALNLKLNDVALRERVLLVRNGKGEKDRYVPFSETALLFLKLYIDNERKFLLKFVKPKFFDLLFLSYKGSIKAGRVLRVFKEYLAKAGIEVKNRVVHSIRHSTATHLLEAGADIRYVAELLGHENIQTTVRYTHLEQESIKKAYKSAHPRENKHYEEVSKEYLKAIDELEADLQKEAEYRSIMGFRW